MNKIAFALVSPIILCTSVAMTGCSTVQYGDAQKVETVTTEFGSTDLQTTAANMVDSMLSFPPIVKATQNKRPVMFVDTIKNKSMEHIDTESLTDTISTKLLRSGKFRFVDMTKVETIKNQLQYQNESGMVDPSTSTAFGKQIGADYMLYGNLSSIVKRDNSTKDVYYKITLKLMDVETGLVEWQDEQEIRKVKSKKLFGG